MSGNTNRETPPANRSLPTVDLHSPLLPADEMVLPTLQGDGKRRWLNPALAKGKYWQRRRLLAYALIAFFVTLPHLRINGKPIVLIDIVAREFTFFGHTFYPTDTDLLLLLMLSVFFTIMFITAIGGRLWCGWGCPQTVYLEFLFRPIDRIFSGTSGKGGKPKKSLNSILQIARFLVYLACSLFLAHTFLSYFVGTDRLAQWMRLTPAQHPMAFGVNKEILARIGAPLPGSWQDLLDPVYKGQIQVPTPQASGTAYNLVASLVALMGEDKAYEYMKKLGPNVQTYTSSGTAPSKAVQVGELKSQTTTSDGL
jgi:hypothetical protein